MAETGGLQQVALSIAKVLDANVTIVDSNLLRLAGTGPYEQVINQPVPRNSVFDKVLSENKAVIIENPGEDPSCMDCPVKEDCVETFQICMPMNWLGVVGVIGIFACDQTQKQSMKAKTGEHIEFLSKMSHLIATWVGESVLAAELAVVIENVDQGVLCLDEFGRIVKYNSRIGQLLGLNDGREGYSGTDLRAIWPNSLALKALNDGKEYHNAEEHYTRGQNSRGLLTSVRLVKHGGKTIGAVGTYSDLTEIHRTTIKLREQNSVTFSDLVGSSPSFVRVKERALRVAADDTTVLVLGESGTGKELFARAIHDASPRADQPFISVNCSAIPESLLESEFFGYEPGAFTGASKKGKPGKIELADKGTFFLDEIGDMPLFLQAKILRFLQEKQITRLGDVKPIDVDVRIIAATNQDLKGLVEKALFREDLYYRLSVIPLTLPPLRERKEDLQAFIRCFLALYNKKLNRNIVGLTPEAEKLFRKYPWPGNVRELENIIQYGISFAEGNKITSEIVAERLAFSEVGNMDKSLKDKVSDYERDLVREALDKYGWTEEGKNQAAASLQISRATLYRKLPPSK